MSRHWLSFLIGLMGCNAILDNQAGWVASNGALPAVPAGEGLPGGEGADAPRTSDAGPDVAKACRAGEHRCAGQCVSSDDPDFGCGADDCASCTVDHAIATCSLGVCRIGKCDPGRADCNQSAADGCESDLSLFETCGACDVSCTTERPLCAPVGETFGCITGCPSDTPQRCESECVDVQTHDAHCGECGHACGPIERCIGGVCRGL